MSAMKPHVISMGLMSSSKIHIGTARKRALIVRDPRGSPYLIQLSNKYCLVSVSCALFKFYHLFNAFT